MRVYDNALLSGKILKLNIFVYALTGEAEAWFRTLELYETDSCPKLVHIFIHE